MTSVHRVESNKVSPIRLLTQENIAAMASSWFNDGEAFRISTDVDYYDLAEDFGCAVRLRVRARGRDLTCYIFTIDLAQSFQELSRELRLTYLEQLYDPRRPS